jgi:uncharacterized MAPEG superfamily protein
MKIGYFCLFLACLLPLIATGIAKAGDRSFNNRRPRDWLAKQDGYRARANAAQANSWEALAMFGFALLSAYQRGADSATIDLLSMVFIVARFGFLAAYLADLHWLRSLVWFVGLGASLALFFI